MKKGRWQRRLICAALIAALVLSGAGCHNAQAGAAPLRDATVFYTGPRDAERCEVRFLFSRLSHLFAKPENADAFIPDTSHYTVSKPSSFTSFSDYVDAWRYMLVNTDFTEVYTVPEFRCTRAELDELLRQVQNAFYFALFDYMEFACFLNQWQVEVSYSIDSGGTCIDPRFTLSLSNGEGLTQREVSDNITAFKAACETIVRGLYRTGALSDSMTTQEKARAILLYTVHNTAFDTTGSYCTGYDAAVRKTAVCQGYTAMYNYLCNLAGVRMECMTGKTGGVGHAWSRVSLDGVWYNVDSTWCDPVPDRAGYCDEGWFWVTDDFLKTGREARSFDCDELSYG